MPKLYSCSLGDLQFRFLEKRKLRLPEKSKLKRLEKRKLRLPEKSKSQFVEKNKLMLPENLTPWRLPPDL